MQQQNGAGGKMRSNGLSPAVSVPIVGVVEGVTARCRRDLATVVIDVGYTLLLRLRLADRTALSVLAGDLLGSLSVSHLVPPQC
jgi:hypothetical protein